ncbi:ATP-dependent Clp protease adaptor protein ClpS [Bradyrhizobium sp. F1.13.1]
MNDTVAKPKTRTKTKVERPKLHKVILINDDFTPREFVTMILKAEFRMTEDQAYKVMITAHKLGACVVAVFTKDVAETKATRATDAGRTKGYPAAVHHGAGGIVAPARLWCFGALLRFQRRIGSAE